MQCEAPANVNADNFSEYWSQLEQTDPTKLINKKLRVHYQIADPADLPGLIATARQQQQQQQQHHHHDHEHAAGGHHDDTHSSAAPEAAALAGAGAVAAGAAAVAAKPTAGAGGIASSSLPDSTPGADSRDIALQEAVEEAESKIRAVSNEISGDKAAAFEGSSRDLLSGSTAAGAGSKLSAPNSSNSINNNNSSNSGDSLLSSSNNSKNTSPTSSASTDIKNNRIAKKSLIERNTDIPLPHVILMVIVAFFLGWFFF